MTNEEEKGGKSNHASTFLDVISGKIGKIGAVVVVLATLVGGFATFMDGVRKIKSSFTELFGGGTKSSNPALCVEAKLLYPPEVSLADWKKMPLSLTGENNCKERVIAFIYFKAPPSLLVLSSPFRPGCNGLKEDDCWENLALEPGPVNLELTRPSLRPLKNPLGEPVPIRINWTLYGKDLNIIGPPGTAEITVHD